MYHTGNNIDTLNTIQIIDYHGNALEEKNNILKTCMGVFGRQDIWGGKYNQPALGFSMLLIIGANKTMVRIDSPCGWNEFTRLIHFLFLMISDNRRNAFE